MEILLRLFGLKHPETIRWAMPSHKTEPHDAFQKNSLMLIPQ